MNLAAAFLWSPLAVAWTYYLAKEAEQNTAGFQVVSDRFFGGRPFVVLPPEGLGDIYDAALAKVTRYYENNGIDAQTIDRAGAVVRVCDGETVSRRVLRVVMLEGAVQN